MLSPTPTFRDSVFVKRPLSPQDDHATLHYMHVYACLCMCCGAVVWGGGGGCMQDHNHQVCGREDVRGLAARYGRCSSGSHCTQEEARGVCILSTVYQANNKKRDYTVLVSFVSLRSCTTDLPSYPQTSFPSPAVTLVPERFEIQITNRILAY